MADRFEVVREIPNAPNVKCDRCGNPARTVRVCRLPKGARLWNYCPPCAHHQAIAYGAKEVQDAK